MSKAPAVQFYFSDYLRDTRSLSLAAKGAWMDCLCDMWFSVTRGVISKPIVGYARLFGCTIDQAKQVIDEIVELRIGDAVTEPNGNLTLINRRMVRDEEDRLANNLRQKKHYDKVKSEEKEKPNGNLTQFSHDSNNPSSSSSSSSVKKECVNAGARDGPEWTYPMKQLVEAFPYLTVTPAMVGFIETEVLPGDEKAWKNTIRIYLMNFDPMKNRYLPDKTANLLSVFRSEKEKLSKGKGNGTNHKLSERDKSAARAVNAERLANAIANGDEQTVRDILGGNGQDHSPVRLTG